jgi:streptogramin lyase
MHKRLLCGALIATVVTAFFACSLLESNLFPHPGPYSVTYDANGATDGTPPTDTTNYPYGKTVEVLGNIGNMVRTGCAFTLWNTQANGSGTSYAPGNTFPMGEGKVTLYAQWTNSSPSAYTVIYNGNGSTGGNVPTDGNNYLPGATVTVVGNTGSLVKTGCDLSSWNTAPNGSGDSYSQGQTFPMASANVILYAQWANMPAWATISFSPSVPFPIAVDGSGKLLIGVQNTDRIDRVDDISGANLITYGIPGQFAYPYGIAIDASGRIYVADTNHSRIVRMDDMSGLNWTTFGSSGSGVSRFSTPYGVAVDSSGRIYVADAGNGRIVRFDDMNGSNWTELGGFGHPMALAIDGQNRIYVSDNTNSRVVRIDDMTGANWISFGSLGSGNGQFNRTIGLALDANGRIYVADEQNNRIVRFDDMTGTNWTTFGASGSGTGQFMWPYGIAIDKAGGIFISDEGNFRIVRVPPW